MNGVSNSSIRRVAGVVIIGAVVLAGTFATAAAFNGGRGQDVEAPVSEAPVSEAPASDAPVQPPAVTPGPTDGGGDAMPIRVDLTIVDNHHDVYVDIVDLSGKLESAQSGTPADGVSVDSYTMKIENLDERTLRLTWSDYPIDNALALYIDETGSRLLLVQPEPTGETDAIALDRQLILTFEEPIAAGDIQGFVQDGLDVPGA